VQTGTGQPGEGPPAPEDEESFWRQQSDAFAAVQAVLEFRVTPAEARRTLARTAGLQRRLIDAAESFAASGWGSADVAALTGAVLRREATRSGRSGEAAITVADKLADRLDPMLDSAGLERLRVGSTSVLTAKAWAPNWLDEDPLPAVDAVEPRRLRVRPPATDLFFQGSSGFDYYATEGQKAAARTVELSPDGSTILVSLPTGVGKSVIGVFGALKPAARGTSVVVVPTISLARDQEVHFREALDGGRVGRSFQHRDFAYLGGTTDSVKAEIRDRVRAGEQGVVYLAPESLLGIAPALADAAYQGLLVDFVIDEAHTVLGWGTDFRPNFQTIAGIRRGLLEACPAGAQFRTILLSATITQYAAEVLRELFGSATREGTSDAGAGGMAIEGALRPEPSYYIAECSDPEQRTARVISALFRVPRPAIVYVTRPTDAENLLAALREAGFARVASYTGASSTRDRERVESGWRDASAAPTSIDVVVATSAFGLGVDQQDVRVVIHAFTPETASRYYQEVGRGGRDGRACASLLLTVRADIPTGRSLARRVFPNEKLRPRWDSMFQHRVAIPGDSRVWVDLDDVRAELRARGVNPGQERNRGWNQRVLTLLQNAGLVELNTPPSTVRPDSCLSPVGLRLLRADMEEPDWDAAWEQERRHGALNATADFEVMQQILKGERCIGEFFAEAFSLRVDSEVREPAVACAGCPACRRQGQSAWRDRPWVATELSGVPALHDSRLSPLLKVAPGRVLAVIVDAVQGPKAVAATLRAATGYGVLLSAGRTSQEAPAATGRRALRPGLADEEGLTPWITVPGSIELVEALPENAGRRLLASGDALFRILFQPPDAPDPAAPHRTIAEMRSIPVLYFDQYLSLLA
jgi:ATP-dependent DNA helicase RecQ